MHLWWVVSAAAYQLGRGVYWAGAGVVRGVGAAGEYVADGVGESLAQRRCAPLLAVGETVILLTSPLHHY